MYATYVNSRTLELSGYLKLLSTLQTHEITDHKLLKTKLFHLYYMHYCMANFHTKKRKEIILHKHSQNKYLFIQAFLFLSF